ncbi:metal-dependent hydrolase [Clostridium pasteurianum DSM 525 = ATCC 6013]|uniref:Metal-dependent hydrolase n=1 Tax=Clostridium pasteurianum DSM 525 = ATCC 6013 TaxID=1262449 RepID=A0A0H3J2R0_CLOPA|nr:MBL fold metallo-hydrolase [Clostridium pasteurianum]AJA46198.1 metal-dependent hydrolase [Clostridium pasteurianum DSM 525 = ATCC 6013]AJA50186.1 metal-dependent hydrolase [Clostridium pasteurianum DSM 525 = ATCC 6013]AOZ73654.1 MBL fold metallo-hydrolase [Clostridium pasteurianum DSM 525 = ATCC 6013]AOZ77451.1 MBL fold metallo-hydrolase [Clostridium pasteurianum]ELP57457.1 Metal-dependent hydrolase [Clostridium pasteurianum DSM 525 = ATCC 6013]
MNEITMLGTGAAMVTRCYNTCFTISSKDEYFLIDTGGGNTILSNLEKMDIPINKIHDVFISHSHNDHVTGIVWIIRAVAQQIINGNYKGKLNIYCHRDVVDIIRTISKLLLQKKFVDHIDKDIVFVEVYDGCKLNILDIDIQCFDIKSTKLLQFGFVAKFNNGKKLTFLGDEPFNENLINYAYKSQYLMHEAFCLYSEKEKFKPYEKHHSTVKDACENASKLEVENVILFHSEDKNLKQRKKLYAEEGKKYFDGKIIVPDDLEIIKIQ